MFDPFPHQSKVSSLSVYKRYSFCNFVDEILQEDSTRTPFRLLETIVKCACVVLWPLHYIKLIVWYDLLINESVLDVLMSQ